MNILVIDGQGGQLGCGIIKALRERGAAAQITAVGTNASASAAMLRAGADAAATGENPVRVACRSADIITGPVGIVIADSLLGEVTPDMAVAVGQARAVRVLIPVNRCDNIVAGTPDVGMSALIDDAVKRIAEIAAK